MCVVAALPGVAMAQDGDPGPYAYEQGAKTVQGGGNDGSADSIEPGSTYKSSLGPQGGSQGERHYRLQLNATDNVYVSVAAIPHLGTKVAGGDGIKVSIRDGDGYVCDDEKVQFGEAASPRPIATVAARAIDSGDPSCRHAGEYFVVVERDSGIASSSDDWGLELHCVSEPPLRPGASEPTTAPETWNSASPAPPAGTHRQRPGGSSFRTATDLDKGVWQEHIDAGQTFFYRVPVAWGQQISATAELTGAAGDDGTGRSDGSGDTDGMDSTQSTGGASGGDGLSDTESSGNSGGSGDGGFVGSALVMTLYNPVRGYVEAADVSYQGEAQSAALPSLPPVAYENRHSVNPQVAAVQFGGWYYLTLSVNPRITKQYGTGAYGVKLTVDVKGSAKSSPHYAGPTKPAGTFFVTKQDGRPAENGMLSTGTDSDGSMRLLAVTAFGAGTALLLVLALWTVLARRRARAAGGVQDVTR